jgi:uncharacterized membrane protein HdeD (DUF308 family)
LHSGSTNIGGLEVPSDDPVFLATVAVHVLIGLTAVFSGVVAMLSAKRAGRHPRAGTLYFWSLAALAATATGLAVGRWSEDYQFFILGVLAFLAALLGRRARRKQWPKWPRYHILGMGSSYVLMLIAFYVDNGKSLPLWNKLPPIAYWLVPAVVGIPLIIRALLRYGFAREPTLRGN